MSRYREDREVKRVQISTVGSVSQSKSLSLLTFQMTEAREISVRVGHVLVFARPPPVAFVRLSGDDLFVSVTCTCVTL